MYLNQNLVLKYKDRINTNLENLIDVNTGEIVKIKFGEVWTCSDISFIDSKDTYYLSGFYFLKNGDREVKIDLKSNLLNDYFMLESEYKKQELEKQKKEEEREKTARANQV
jgi:Zn-finger protein